MWTVYKYEIGKEASGIPFSETLIMPEGAEILHVGEQEGKIFLWARVDTTAKKTGRQIACAGTGHLIPTWNHVGTALLYSGTIVVHVFDGGERSN